MVSPLLPLEQTVLNGQLEALFDWPSLDLPCLLVDVSDLLTC